MYAYFDYIDAIKMTRAQAQSATHPGPCDDDVKALTATPAIRRQLDKIDPEALRKELKQHGAWSTEELADHEQNKQRIVWIAAGDICDQ